MYPDSNGYANLVVATFTPGTHTVAASYAGGGKYSAAFATTTVTIQSNDFAISLDAPALTVASGQLGHTSVVLMSLGVFADSLKLTAGATPQYLSLGFSPGTVSLKADGTRTSMLTIYTAEDPDGTPVGRQVGGSTSATQIAHSAKRGAPAPIFAALCAVPLLLIRRRRLRNLLAALLLTAAITGMSGCTNIYYLLNRVNRGTYAIPITATDTISGLSHTATLTLTVTP